MEWIRSGELQGIAALVTTLHIIVIAGRSLAGARVTPGTGELRATADLSRPRPGITAHILGGVDCPYMDAALQAMDTLHLLGSNILQIGM